MNNFTGVVILGHGSRAAAAGLLLNKLAESVAARLECPVLPASLQFNKPTLEESCRRLGEDGVRRIVIAPYFLFEGNHLARDIPEEIAAIKEVLPDVELMLAGSLGADDRLAEILIGRIKEAFNGQDSHSGVPAGERRLSGHPIELESFDIIDGILAPENPEEPAYQIARRVVHTTGDPGMAGRLVISDDAVQTALSAFASGGHIICDVNMVAAGIMPTAAKMGLEVHCLVADRETAELAAREGITRGAAGIRRAAEESISSLKNAVVVIGNAPTALFECLRLAAKPETRPAVIVGVPVGFVGAAESKQALMDSGLPYVTIPGNRGGSNIAVAITNALMRLSDKPGLRGAKRISRMPQEES